MSKHIKKHVKKHFKKHRYTISQILRWALVILATLTLSIKIAEVSAEETLRLFIDHPELAANSVLVKHGYLLIR